MLPRVPPARVSADPDGQHSVALLITHPGQQAWLRAAQAAWVAQAQAAPGSAASAHVHPLHGGGGSGGRRCCSWATCGERAADASSVLPASCSAHCRRPCRGGSSAPPRFAKPHRAAGAGIHTLYARPQKHVGHAPHACSLHTRFHACASLLACRRASAWWDRAGRRGVVQRPPQRARSKCLCGRTARIADPPLPAQLSSSPCTRAALPSDSRQLPAPLLAHHRPLGPRPCVQRQHYMSSQV